MSHEELEILARGIGQKIAICQKEVLTLDEASQYSGISKSYLYKMMSSRLIKHYKPNGKICYFKRKELDEWLTSVAITPDCDLNTAAIKYCLENPLNLKQ